MQFPIPLFTEVPNIPVFLTQIVAPHCGPRTAARSSVPDIEASGHHTTLMRVEGSKILRTISVGVGPTEVWSLTFVPAPVNIGMIDTSVAQMSTIFLCPRMNETHCARADIVQNERMKRLASSIGVNIVRYPLHQVIPRDTTACACCPKERVITYLIQLVLGLCVLSRARWILRG